MNDAYRLDPTVNGPYGDPIVYDILHAPGTDREVDGLDRVARRYCGRTAESPFWLEPACGTGRYLRVAVRRGCRVAGFDSSPRMIAYARGRLRRISETGWEVLVADLTRFARQFEPGSVDFAFNLQNTIRHLPDDEAMLAHLREMERVMRPRGVYAVGLDLAAYGNDIITEDVWCTSRGRCEVSQVVQYVPPPDDGSRREVVISHLAIRRPRGVEHRDQKFALRTYDAPQWSQLIERSPLEVVDIVDEDGNSTRQRPFAYGIHLLRRRD